MVWKQEGFSGRDCRGPFFVRLGVAYICLYVGIGTWSLSEYFDPVLLNLCPRTHVKSVESPASIILPVLQSLKSRVYICLQFFDRTSHSTIRPEMQLKLLPTSLVLLAISYRAIAGSAASTITAPAPTSTSFTSDAAFESAMLVAHNFYRTEHATAPLTWNATSATYAAAWSSKCVFKHSVSPPSLPSAHLLTVRYRADQLVRTWQRATRMPRRA
jgi:hypothetical protein